MLRKTKQIFMIYCLFFPFVVFAETTNVHPVEKARQKLMLQVMQKQLVRDVKVNANVVSEKGEQLNGILLELVVLDENGRRTEKRIVDKTFALNYKNVIRVDVTITKPGYYEEKKVFAANLMYEDRFVVELVEIGQPVALQEYDGFISFCPTGMSVVVDFTSSEEMLKSLLTSDLVSKKDNLPKLGMCILADTNETNAFEVQSWRDTHVPRGVRLQSLSTEDGFIPFECLEQNPARADRRMRIAPELGYESAILVPPSDKRFYFYCKIAGRYGKGYVSPVTRVSTGNKIETPFRILLQSEKSNDRNVTGSR